MYGESQLECRSIDDVNNTLLDVCRKAEEYIAERLTVEEINRDASQLTDVKSISMARNDRDDLLEKSEIKKWKLLGYSDKEALEMYVLSKKYSDAIGFASEADVGSLLRMFKGTKIGDVSYIKDSDERKIYESENLTIPKLKKRIKYCNNPLEKKQLQRELNVAYKKAVNSRRRLANVVT